MVMTHVKHTKAMVLLQDLNMMDRFLFDEVLEDPETHQDVLNIILPGKIELLDKNEVEKQLQTSPYLKSVRLDVFAMDNEKTVYNTEMQKNWKSDLRKRSRFYQALIDSGLLPAGNLNYNKLNDSYIIMITPFDLFGYGLYQYTFESTCQEVPNLQIEDGATRIFLNTKGTNPQDVSEELVEFLKYVEKTDNDTAAEVKSERVKRIHRRVLEIKSNEEMGVKYMQAWEEKAYEREEGREEGELNKVINQIKRKVLKNLSPETIAEHLDESVSFVERVCNMIEKNPDADADTIRSILQGDTDKTEI